MSLRARLLSWLRHTVHRADLEQEMHAEMRLHVELYEADLRGDGLPEAEARRRARAAFGSLDARKDECREALGLRLLGELRADVRYAVRMLRRSPSFAIVAVLSLGFGIGANTAIFSLVDTVLLKSLPVREPERLFFVDNSGGKSGGGNGPPYPCYEILRDHNRYFSGLAAFNGAGPLNVTIDGVAERIRAQYASGSYFDVLGVRSLYGRVFTPSDDLAPSSGGPETPPAVISDALWERRFGRSPSILGKAIQVGQTWVTIVGVTPRAFRGLQAGSPVDLTVPMAVSENRLSSKQYWWFSVVGRLKDNASIEEARADLDGMFQAYMTRNRDEGKFARILRSHRARARGQGRQRSEAQLRDPALDRHDHRGAGLAHRLRQRGEPAPRAGKRASWRDRRCAWPSARAGAAWSGNC